MQEFALASATSDPAPAPPCTISRFAVRAADVETSLAFYRDRFGLPEALRLHHGDGSLMLVALRVGEDPWIEIFDGKRLRPPRAARMPARSGRPAPPFRIPKLI